VAGTGSIPGEDADDDRGHPGLNQGRLSTARRTTRTTIEPMVAPTSAPTNVSDRFVAIDIADTALAAARELGADPRRLVGRMISLDEAPVALMAMDGPQPVAGMTVIMPQLR